mgnify:CR=1 FL=1
MLLIISVSFATYFVLKALEDKVVFFYSPTELKVAAINPEDIIRIGGIVLKDSTIFYENSMKVSFIVTDNKEKITVFYEGILPDLFREGQGVVVEGSVNNDYKRFFAKTVLAKHDENYMPPSVKKALD